MASVKGGVGTWEPPPTMAMTVLAAGAAGAAAVAFWNGACDIGSILAAIAFVFGLVGSIDLSLWRSRAVPRSAKGGTGTWEPPPTARSQSDSAVGGVGGWEPPPVAPIVVHTGGTALLLAALLAEIQDRCPLAAALAAAALILLLLSLFQLRSLGSRG